MMFEFDLLHECLRSVLIDRMMSIAGEYMNCVTVDNQYWLVMNPVIGE